MALRTAVVDPADMPSALETDPAKNFVTWGMCSGVDRAKGKATKRRVAPEVGR